MIIAINQDSQSTVLDNLHEPSVIVAVPLVSSGNAPRAGERAAQVVKKCAGLVENHLQQAPIPANQAGGKGAAGTEEIELAHQQTRSAQGREMNPEVFSRRDQNRRTIARDVAHFEPAILEQPGEALAVARQGKRFAAGSVGQAKRAENGRLAKQR